MLTSGGAPTALDGIDTVRAIVRAADGRIEIMAGSGVNAASAVALADAGVDALHFSAKRTIAGRDELGFGGYEVTDRDAALAVRTVLQV